MLTLRSFTFRSPAVALGVALVVGLAVPFALADGESAETAAITRIDRANRHVEDLHELRGVLLKNDAVSSATHKKLLQIIRGARGFAKPVTVGELTAGERESLAKDLASAAEKKKSKAYLDRARARLLDIAVDGAELAATEEASARRVVDQWFAASKGARAAGDSKKVSDLIRERDKELRKALGRKKAKRVISNLNSLSGWYRPR